jgi:hypothetical protein
MSSSRPYAWRAEKDADWLDIAPAAGTGVGRIVVRVWAAGLAPGRYFGSLTVFCSDAANSPQRIRVSFTVLEPLRFVPRDRFRPKADAS